MILFPIIFSFISNLKLLDGKSKETEVIKVHVTKANNKDVR